MIIQISYGSLWISSHYLEVKLEITGTGTIDDPFLFNTKNNFITESYELRVSDSRKYIKFSGIYLKGLYLNNCENVRISKARVRCLGLENCSRISILNSDITKELRLDKVNMVKVVDSNIKKLFAFSGDQILISNCEINRISRKSKALIYRRDVNTSFWNCYDCEAEIDLFSRFCHNCGSRIIYQEK
ncbi:MAG: hypothetical protein ACFE8L_09570 [Candidatus Hodarchaeota archaeon]